MPEGALHELFRGPRPRRLVIGLALAVAGPAGVTGLMAAVMAPPGVGAPLLMLTVILAAAIGGIWAGLLAAGAAWAGFAWLLAPPVGAVRLGDTDLFAAAAFVAVAVLLAYEEAARAGARLARDRLVFLAEAGRRLSGSLDFDRVLSTVPRMVVPTFADFCGVLASPEEGATLGVEAAHEDATREEALRSLWERFPPDPHRRNTPLSRVLGTGRPEVVRTVKDEQLRSFAENDDHLETMRELGIRSLITVPLEARGRTLGALWMAFGDSGRRYGRGDLAFVEELARICATALDNARLFRERSRIAQTLQSSLLPTDLPTVPGVEVAVRYRAAGEGLMVGGDFYDLFETGDGWAVALGDVCGKGPEAAALTGLVRHTIRTASVQTALPSEVLNIVNRQVVREGADRYCTVTFARARLEGDRLRLAVSCGGHPPPLVCRPGRTVEAAECLGTLLGVFPDPDLTDVELELSPGDSIVFYTDGVTEVYERVGDSGDARLVSLLWESDGLDATAIADGIYRDAIAVQDGQLRDDLAVVVMRLSPEGPRSG